MTKLYDISDWNEESWWNTGGTRNKKIYSNPDDGLQYYFKQSYKTEKRDYKYEFWSEIIASQLGASLGFDVLPYHVAINKHLVGCLSKSMFDPSRERLVEGGKYLKAFDNSFNPDDTKLRNQYNFELIVKALTSFSKEKHVEGVLSVIVFDALIGNSDRHQENWAIVHTQDLVEETMSKLEPRIDRKNFQNTTRLIQRLIDFFYTPSGEIKAEIEAARLMISTQTRFAPIYDSGCCFGRELEEERVRSMLLDGSKIKAYIEKGCSEIHWESKKITHFELLEKLLSIDKFKLEMLRLLEKVCGKYDSSKVEEDVFNVDNALQGVRDQDLIPQYRKELIIKILDFRLTKLREVLLKYR